MMFGIRAAALRLSPRDEIAGDVARIDDASSSRRERYANFGDVKVHPVAGQRRDRAGTTRSASR